MCHVTVLHQLFTIFFCNYFEDKGSIKQEYIFKGIVYMVRKQAIFIVVWLKMPPPLNHMIGVHGLETMTLLAYTFLNVCWEQKIF